MAAALGGRDRAYQQGHDEESLLQSKLGQAMAQIAAHNAQANKYDADAAGDRQKQAIIAGRPALVDELTAGGAGTDVPMVRAIRQFMQSGQRPQVPMGPETEAGEYGVGSQQFDPEVQSRVVQQIARLAPVLLGSGDIDISHWAKAQGEYRDQDLGDAVLNGRRTAADVGRAQAAVKATPIYNKDATGAVLDLFSGGVDVNNPMAQGSITLKKEQAGAQKANAAQSYASGDASRALADQRRAVTAAGPSPGRVPIGYRYAAGADGEMRLEPIPGGPKDPNAQTGKPLPASASKGLLENQQNLRRAQTALALIEGKTIGDAKGDKDATGWKGLVPNQLLNRMDASGVETRAAIADLGSLVIHDRSGAAVTAAEFPRLAPFIPSAVDDAKTAKKKLAQFVKVYGDIVGESVDFYRASGFNVPDTALRDAAEDKPADSPAAPQRIAGDAEYNSLPSGATFIGPDGKTRRKP